MPTVPATIGERRPFAIRSCSVWAKAGVMPSTSRSPRKLKTTETLFPSRSECGVPLVATVILLLFMIQASMNVDAPVPSFLASLATMCEVTQILSPTLDISLGTHFGGP